MFQQINLLSNFIAFMTNPEALGEGVSSNKVFDINNAKKACKHALICIIS